MALNWFKYASPATFYPLAGRMIPWFAVAAAACAAVGLWLGFGVAPTDFQQGEVYRIIFIHVPAAWMSMFLYVVMAAWGALLLGFNTRLSGMMAQAIAPTGALMTFVALWSGALWGRPTWGTYWAWDARMTSELILLFLYFGIIALRQAIGQAYPEVAKFELIDYKVRILDQGHGTDAITRVLIETSDGASSWVTVGVGHNVIEASWGALVDGVTFGLRRHQV